MSWQRVRGHDRLIEAFERVVNAGRLGHAYLFTGPNGVGKRLFAGELAKALLCEGKRAGKLESCGTCPACVLVNSGNHPDLTVVGRPEESLELPIETVRELSRTLSFKPARGKYKVAILDDADDLNVAAANCFLKTLEEPPPGSLLILIGTDAERQLSTIVSRCQVIPFAPLADSLVAELLREQGMEDAVLVDRLTKLSGGSLGQARALADPALWDFRRALLEGITQPRVNAVALAKQWTEFLEEAGKEPGVQRRRATLVLGLLVEFLNDALRFSVGGSPRLEGADDMRFLRELGNRLGPDNLLELMERCLEADYHIDRRVQLVLALEALVDALGQGLHHPSYA